MKRLDETYRVYQDDDLVKRWYSAVHGENLSQGKRVTTDTTAACHLITAEERRTYVRLGSVAAIKLIRARLNCSIHSALKVLREARGDDA